MSKGEIPPTIEYEVSAHLRHVELLGMPDLSAQGKPEIARGGAIANSPLRPRPRRL
jgi:hypothetical protein